MIDVDDPADPVAVALAALEQFADAIDRRPIDPRRIDWTARLAVAATTRAGAPELRPPVARLLAKVGIA